MSDTPKCQHCGHAIHQETFPAMAGPVVEWVDDCGNDGCYVSESAHVPA